jgi:uncharacterized protein (DUF952 family)
MFIYHIVLPEVWEKVRGDKLYRHESLAAEGFIHCSYEDQLGGVIERYYADRDELVILTIDTERLAARLVAEPSTGGEVYPHIYGPLNMDAIAKAEIRKLPSF